MYSPNRPFAVRCLGVWALGWTAMRLSRLWRNVREVRRVWIACRWVIWWGRGCVLDIWRDNCALEGVGDEGETC